MPFFISTSDKWRLWFLLSSSTLVTVHLLMRAILVGMKWCLILVLIHISLMAGGAEHLFMCLLATCMSIQTLCRVLNWVLLFYCKSSLYILDTSPLSATCIAKFLSHFGIVISLFFFFGDRVSFCFPGWNAVAWSQLTAASASRVQVVLLPQPPA